MLHNISLRSRILNQLFSLWCFFFGFCESHLAPVFCDRKALMFGEIMECEFVVTRFRCMTFGVHRMSNRLRIDASSQDVALFLRHQAKYKIESERDSFAVHWIQLATLLCHRCSINTFSCRSGATNYKRTCCLFTFRCTLCRSDFVFTSNWRLMAENFTTNHDKSETNFFISCVRFCSIFHLTPSREKFLFAFSHRRKKAKKQRTKSFVKDVNRHKESMLGFR